jgi:uncharacterized hydrophobic protein (TIGR00271 family)
VNGKAGQRDPSAYRGRGREGGRTLSLLDATSSAANLVHLPGTVRHPDGDLIVCDVPSEDVSAIVASLGDLDVPLGGSIAIEPIATQISEGTTARENEASASDAVVWEEVDSRVAGMTALSANFLMLMALAMLIAMAGILRGTAILIVGAMIVGPDFGPVAGICVATVERRAWMAGRSLAALLAGFAAGITVAVLTATVFRLLGAFPGHLVETPEQLPQAVSLVVGRPGFFTFFVAFAAGIAGMLSLSTAKFGVLIGVLVSVTTIPAAANLALATASARWPIAAGSAEQLGANITTLLIAGIITLAAQRVLYARRRRSQHRHDCARAAAELPASGS